MPELLTAEIANEYRILACRSRKISARRSTVISLPSPSALMG